MSLGIDALQAPMLKYMWYTIILSLIVKYFLSQPNPITPKISLGNSPYCIPYNSYDFSSENLVFYQLIIYL